MAKIFEWNPNKSATGTGGSVATITDTSTNVVEGVMMGCSRLAEKISIGRDSYMYLAKPMEPALSLDTSEGVLVADLQSEFTNLLISSESFNSPSWDVNGDIWIENNKSMILNPRKESSRIIYRYNASTPAYFSQTRAKSISRQDFNFSIYVMKNNSKFFSITIT